MATSKLHTDNPELLQFIDSKLHITILGGIKFTGLDRLKVTVKIVHTDNKQATFRHNLDLYNHIQSSQLIERSAELLDIQTIEVSNTINQLITALEEYRAAHLESLKPKPQEVKQLTEAEGKAAIAFLKQPTLIKQSRAYHPKWYHRRRNQRINRIPCLHFKKTCYALTPDVFRSIRYR